MTRAVLSRFFSSTVIVLYAVYFISVFFGLRLINSVSIATITGLGLLLMLCRVFAVRKKDGFNLFIAGCLLFYLIQLAGLLYTHNSRVGLRQVELKFTLILIPVMLWPVAYPEPLFRKKVMPWYTGIVVGGLIICLLVAAKKYGATHDSSVFFYHALVKPFLNHAIQTSILVFIALVYLLEGCRTKTFFWNKTLHFCLIAFFLVVLLLLASKLVIVFSFASCLLYLALLTRNQVLSRKKLMIYSAAGVIVLLAVLITDNPVSTRFKDIFNGDISKIEQPTFIQGDYFNGIQFRLLEWKFVTEILSERHAWLLGVSPGDGQAALDAKYRAVNMYIGDGKRNHGFIGYNTHNQFLESTLQSGLAGLGAFLLLVAGLFQLMIRRRQAELWLTGVLLLLYCFQDAVLQTQFGIEIFVFFPLFLYYGTAALPRTSAPQAATDF